MNLRVRTAVPVVMALAASLAASGAEATRGVRVKPVAPTGEPAVGDNWLFIVAIGKYEEWDSLRGPRKDAEGIKKVLLDRYDFEPEHVVELYDEKAGVANINRAFRELIGKIRPSDSLLVYYAGHGYTDTVSGTGYWIPYDAGRDELVHERWLPNTEIRGLLRAMKCKHVLLVSDSCFSGDMLKEHRGRKRRIDQEYYRRAYAMASRQVLTSGASEPVSDTDLGGHSAFAFQLIRTLEQNTKPYLDPTELHVYIRAGIEGQQPLVGTLKHAGHQEGGSYLLFLRQGPAPAERKRAESEAAAKGQAEGEIAAARAAFQKIVTAVGVIGDPTKKADTIERLRAESLIDLAGTPYDERLVAMAEMERRRAARAATASEVRRKAFAAKLPTGPAHDGPLRPAPDADEERDSGTGSPRLSLVVGSGVNGSRSATGVMYAAATLRLGRGRHQFEFGLSQGQWADDGYDYVGYGLELAYCRTFRNSTSLRPFVRVGLCPWREIYHIGGGMSPLLGAGVNWYVSEKLTIGGELRVGMASMMDGYGGGFSLGFNW